MHKFLSFLVATIASLSIAYAQHNHHHGKTMGTAIPAQADRAVVKFPLELKEHTLANMRDHLKAISEIQDHLSQGHFEVAGKIAESRLGMSALKDHGAHEAAKYMPQGMQEIGSSMHRAASQFWVVAQEAEVTRDYQKTLNALSKITSTCVACHASYKFQ